MYVSFDQYTSHVIYISLISFIYVSSISRTWGIQRTSTETLYTSKKTCGQNSFLVPEVQKRTVRPCAGFFERKPCHVTECDTSEQNYFGFIATNSDFVRWESKVCAFNIFHMCVYSCTSERVCKYTTCTAYTTMPK